MDSRNIIRSFPSGLKNLDCNEVLLQMKQSLQSFLRKISPTPYEPLVAGILSLLPFHHLAYGNLDNRANYTR